MPAAGATFNALTQTKPGSIQGTRVVEALDLGLPVTIGGVEYVMLDKLYARVPLYSTNNSPSGHTLLGHEMTLSNLLVMVATEMSEQEWVSLTARNVLNDKQIKRRFSTSVMIGQARQLADKAYKKGLSLPAASGCYDENERPVRDSIILTADSSMSYAPSRDLSVTGTEVESFEVFLNAQFRKKNPPLHDHNIAQQGSIRIGTAYRNAGFDPNPAFLSALDRCYGASVAVDPEDEGQRSDIQAAPF